MKESKYAKRIRENRAAKQALSNVQESSFSEQTHTETGSSPSDMSEHFDLSIYIDDQRTPEDSKVPCDEFVILRNYREATKYFDALRDEGYRGKVFIDFDYYLGTNPLEPTGKNVMGYVIVSEALKDCEVVIDCHSSDEVKNEEMREFWKFEHE